MDARHLAETQPHNDQKLQDWDTYFIKVSAVNHSVSAIFLHLYDGGLCWVFKGKFKGAVFDIVIGFGLD
jgi:hypothetical protein